MPGKVVRVPRLHHAGPGIRPPRLCLGMRTGREIGLARTNRQIAGDVNQRGLAPTMKIYNATIRYKLVQRGRREKLNTPEDVMRYMTGAFDHAPWQESFYVIPLNGGRRPLGRILISLGTATCALAHPREVFRVAILAGACCSIICVHNHPGGEPHASAMDHKLTRKIRDAGILLGIELLDHVIIGTPEDDPQGLGYFSFRNAGHI